MSLVDPKFKDINYNIIIVSKNYTSSDKIVSESIVIFEQVNSKINELIGCSVKDFEILNKSFQKYFISLQAISDATNNFITSLIGISQNDFFSGTIEKEEFSNNEISEGVSNYLGELKTLHEKLNYYELIINNLNQDLSTIRLLFTNLKFDPLIKTNHNTAKTNINNISNCLAELDDNIKNLNATLFEAIKFTDEGLINALDLFSEQFENIHDCYQHIKHQVISANTQLSKIDQLEKKKNSHTSEIITHLQFQDILRQKIEHVQEAHEAITNDLRKAQKTNEELNPADFFKIRDITTLQSAQLIHSNQEYQTAVETILKIINELNTLLNKYLSIWNHFCKPENSKLQSLKTRLSEHMSLLNTQSFSLTHIADKFDASKSKLSAHIKAMHKIIGKSGYKLCSFSELQDQFKKLQAERNNSQNNGAIKQLEIELNKFESEFSKLNEELVIFSEQYNTNKLFPESSLNNEFESIQKYSKQNIDFFNNFLSKILDDLIPSSVKIESNTGFNIQEVSYYKVFEKEIGKIISLLDNLLEKINVSRSDIDFESLEHLRKNYTMDSERKVHDIITQRNNQEKEKDKDSENDVEFF